METYRTAQESQLSFKISDFLEIMITEKMWNWKHFTSHDLHKQKKIQNKAFICLNFQLFNPPYYFFQEWLMIFYLHN